MAAIHPSHVDVPHVSSLSLSRLRPIRFQVLLVFHLCVCSTHLPCLSVLTRSLRLPGCLSASHHTLGRAKSGWSSSGSPRPRRRTPSTRTTRGLTSASRNTACENAGARRISSFAARLTTGRVMGIWPRRRERVFVHFDVCDLCVSVLHVRRLFVRVEPRALGPQSVFCGGDPHARLETLCWCCQCCLRWRCRCRCWCRQALPRVKCITCLGFVAFVAGSTRETSRFSARWGR